MGHNQHTAITPFSEMCRLERKREYIVAKHNEIIQGSKYNLERENVGKSLSLVAQKMLLFIVSKIKPDDTELKEQTFTIKEFCEVFGINAEDGNKYKYLKEAINTIDKETGKMWVTNRATGEEVTVEWIRKASINRGSGKIKIQFDEDMKPFLIKLVEDGNYTQYSLHSVFRMKSKYGIMLFELLKSYAYNRKSIIFSVEELKEYMDCTGVPSYENFTNFRKKVIDAAVADINKYSEISVSYTPYKTGRSYTSIEFTVKILDSRNREDLDELQKRYDAAEMELQGYEK